MELTEAAIDELEAGPELDALIAEWVMGWQRGEAKVISKQDGQQVGTTTVWYPNPPVGVGWMNEHMIPKFSTTWEGAGMVWEAIDMPLKRLTQDSSTFNCVFGNRMQQIGDNWKIAGGQESLGAPTPFVAICRAALKVKLLG